MRFLYRFLALLVLGGIAAGVIGAVVMLGLALKTLPDPQKLASFSPAFSSKVYSADGQQIGLFARENRSFMPLEQVPNHVIAAFMAAEDKDFYSHAGVDLMGVSRAILYNISTVGRSRRMQGASTITQQVAENVLLIDGNRKRGLDRYVSKVQEALISFRIESMLTKDQIMEIYLNQIFLGYRSYGVEAAAQTYFGKSVRDITIAQAAFLGALPKGPNNYDPIKRTANAKGRRDWVIGRMVAAGFISRAQANAALQEPLNYVPHPRGSWTNPEAGEFVEEVRRDLIRRFGPDAPYSRGFIVRTTMDMNAQRAARRALQNGLNRFSPNRARGFAGALGNLTIDENWAAKLGRVRYFKPEPNARLGLVMDNAQKYGLVDGRKTNIPQADKDWAARSNRALADGQIVWLGRRDDATYQLRRHQSIQGALVSINAHTGAVVAMAGGYDIEDSGFNRATQARRQPGSAIKPIIYAAALEQGMTPTTKISDSKITGGGWGPENADRRFMGMITLRQALVLSRNTVTVRIARRIGMRRIADYARRFGVYQDLPNDLTMALGAGETSVLKLTSAFGVFPNGGRYVPPVFYDRLQDSRGNTVWRADRRYCAGCDAPFDPKIGPPRMEAWGTQVVSPRTAWEMVQILLEVVTNGTGRSAGFSHPVGGKTGTTSDYKDAWFVGFSPTYVTGVFVGYDLPRTIAQGAAGGTVSAPIFREFMSNYLADKPIEQFAPNAEAMREIGAEERMRMIDVLQTKPRLVPRPVRRAAPTAKEGEPSDEAATTPLPEAVVVPPEAAPAATSPE
ncbi:MAG: penicillin-binding protein 1A family [Hyphomonadaceae bacterium]|nr:MAG: penicillin-binding protein 1A family [Hyphomonadaceae bacterium]